MSCCSYWDVESLGVDGFLEGPRIRLLPDDIKNRTKGSLQLFFGEHCRKQEEWSGGGGQIDNNQLHSEHTHPSRLGKCKQEDALNYLILILLSILTFCITYHSLTTIYDEAMQDVGTQHLVSWQEGLQNGLSRVT